LQSDGLYTLIDILTKGIFEDFVHIKLVDIECFTQLIYIYVGIYMGVDVVHDIVGNFGMFLECCTLHRVIITKIAYKNSNNRQFYR